MKKTKKITAMVLTLITVILSVSAQVSALETSEEKNLLIKYEDNIGEEQILEEISLIDEYFSKDEILAFADYHKDTYLEGKISGKDVFVGEDIIPMYNLDDELEVWYVPYLYNDGSVAGYIIIGSNMNSYNFYAIIENADNFYNAKVLYEQGKELIFAPFNNLVYKEENTYYDNLSTESSSKKQKSFEVVEGERTDNIQKNIQTTYDAIFTDSIKEKNRSENITLLSSLKSIATLNIKERESEKASSKVLTRAATIDARLTQEWASTPYFLNVPEGTKLRYGGNQSWFSSELYRKEGCGIVAAANITAYLAKYKSGKSRLYSTAGNISNITNGEFRRHMDYVSQYVYPRPGATLIPGVTADRFESSVLAYASSKGVSLQLDKSVSNLHDFWNASNYLVQSLNDNRPVAICLYGSNDMLNYEEYGYHYYWHWMTVTKYFQNSSDMRWVALSTWGQRHSLNWRFVHNYQNGSMSGVYNRIFSFK